MRFFLILCLLFPCNALAQKPNKSAYHAYSVEEIVSGLEHPWGMTFLPGGNDILVTERPGRLRLIRNEKLLPPEIKGLPEIFVSGQGGLLDVTHHPDFKENRLIYISYAEEVEGHSNTAVGRARLDGLNLTNFEVIFQAMPKVKGSHHWGSRLLFTPDKNLFITLGDRYAYMQEAQSPYNHFGAVVRLDDQGEVLQNSKNTEQENIAKGLYSYGPRNVQGIIWHPIHEEIWIHEHGPRGGDEINYLIEGGNYGWPEVTYGIDYSGAIISERQQHAPEFIAPLYQWTPSIAPSGMAYYDGDEFSSWQGDIFIGSLAHTHLQRIRFDESKQPIEKEKLLEGWEQRIRDVEVGPDGALYILTDSSNSGLYRLVNKD